jgi:Flp pilus assembly protein TadG
MGSLVGGEPAESKHDAADAMMTSFPKFRRSEGGATAVEMAVVLMAVILLILGMIEFSIAYWNMHTLLLAVEEVGRWVMVNNTTVTTAAAQTRMQQYLPAASSICTTPSAGQYCVSATASNGRMTLIASYGYNVIGITGSPLILKSQNTVPLD